VRSRHTSCRIASDTSWRSLELVLMEIRLPQSSFQFPLYKVVYFFMMTDLLDEVKAGLVFFSSFQYNRQ